MAFEAFSLENPLFRTYIVYTSVLVFKMLAMAVLTGRQRHKKHVFANPEDIINQKSKIKFDDVDVERVRRAHLNDLENIPMFFVIASFYILTDPSVFLATNLIRLFTAGRVLHTLVYAVCPLPQPARGLSWAAGYFTTIFMAASVFITFISDL